MQIYTYHSFVSVLIFTDSHHNQVYLNTLSAGANLDTHLISPLICLFSITDLQEKLVRFTLNILRYRD